MIWSRKRPFVSYTWKLMAALLVFVMLPFVLLGFQIYNMTVTDIYKQSHASFVNEVEHAREYMNKRMENAETLFLRISMNPVIQRYFANPLADIENVEVSKQYLDPLLDWIKTMYVGEYDIHFFTENDTAFKNAWIHPYTFLKPSIALPKEQPLQNSPYWEPMHPKRIYPYENSNLQTYTSDEQVISLFIPVSNITSEKKTIMEIVFNPAYFLPEPGSSVYANEMSFYIMDANDFIVYNSDEANALVSITQAIGDHKLSHDNDQVLHFDNNAYYVGLRPLSRMGYYFIAVNPQPEFIKRVEFNRIVFVASVCSAFLALLIMAFVFAKSLTKKMRYLLKAIRNVRNGDLNYQIHVKGNDEFSELSHNFNHMTFQINSLIESVYKAEMLQKEASLKALENQVNPHFLYNALETIRMMAVIHRAPSISDALASLGSILRYNLQDDGKEVKLGLEMRKIQDYCNLYNIMLNGRLTLHTALDDDIADSLILKFLIQPLVENALQHAFVDGVSNCVITISVRVERVQLVIMVADNGSGIPQDRLEELQAWLNNERSSVSFAMKNGVGLKNVMQRISHYYGQPFTMEMTSKVGQGTTVILYLPLKYA